MDTRKNLWGDIPNADELRTPYRTHLRSQEGAASRFSMSLTKQRLSLVVA
jgi:hypothetical protein